MTSNTPYFAEFIKAARNTANLTQDMLSERGAPYRQMQGKVENGELHELEPPLLAQYDSAYGWPRGYAAAVAQAAAYSSGDLTGSVLDDGDRPTLADQYKPDRSNNPPALGFNPATGQPVWPTRPILTNIGFQTLKAIIDSRAGTTLLDINAVDESSLRDVATGPIATERHRMLYRTAPGEGTLTDISHLAQPIAIDPLTDLTNMVEARRLSQALLAIYPDTDTTVEKAAFTFLAIAAFGKDPFITITALLSGGPLGLPGGGSLLNEFTAFWDTFRDRENIHADLMKPDLNACRLLAGLSAARTSALSLEIGAFYPGHQRTAKYSPPTTTRSEDLALPSQDSLVLYDSHTAPEAPVCLSNAAIGAVLSVYRAPALKFRKGERPTFPYLPDPLLMVRSIGITPDVDDLTLVAHHRRDQLDTLTNLVGDYAVYCESGMATVVWIPAV